MLKYTKQSVIAFDFKEAPQLRRRDWPYAQYAVVRATSHLPAKRALIPIHSVEKLPATSPPRSPSIDWRSRQRNLGELWLTAAKTSYIARPTASPPLSRPTWPSTAFQLAQFFNTFYHRHPILSEPDQNPQAVPAIYGRGGAPRIDSYAGRNGVTVPPVM